MHPSVQGSTVYKTWEELKCPLTEGWIKKMWCVYIYLYTHMCASAYMSTKEYYSAIKKNEIRPFAATWVDLESVIQVK